MDKDKDKQNLVCLDKVKISRNNPKKLSKIMINNEIIMIIRFH